MALCTTNQSVEYCSVAPVPYFFNNDYSQNSDDCRLFYDPTCLKCIVEPCEVEVPCCEDGQTTFVTLYAAKIVGCMPYQAEWRFNNPAVCNVPTSSGRNASVSALSGACFAHCVKIGSEEVAKACCDCINEILSDPARACALITNSSRFCELFNCDDCTEITSPSTDGKCTDRFVKFRGEFLIDCTELSNECPECGCNG